MGSFDDGDILEIKSGVGISFKWHRDAGPKSREFENGNSEKEPKELSEDHFRGFSQNRHYVMLC